MPNDIHQHRILILDFGSQYTQLIARRVREIGVYCEIWPWDATQSDILKFAPRGVILSGGPESVHTEDGPQAPEVIFELDVPVLGICYGLHTMAAQLGGTVVPSTFKEFGYARVRVEQPSRLLQSIEDHVDEEGKPQLDVWMSHGDKVVELPEGFELTAETENCPIAGMAHKEKPFYGIQFLRTTCSWALPW
jgi:GMP synthase (glutamine-hydrolysing)